MLMLRGGNDDYDIVDLCLVGVGFDVQVNTIKR